MTASDATINDRTGEAWIGAAIATFAYLGEEAELRFDIRALEKDLQILGFDTPPTQGGQGFSPAVLGVMPSQVVQPGDG